MKNSTAKCTVVRYRCSTQGYPTRLTFPFHLQKTAKTKLINDQFRASFKFVNHTDTKALMRMYGKFFNNWLLRFSVTFIFLSAKSTLLKVIFKFCFASKLFIFIFFYARPWPDQTSILITNYKKKQTCKPCKISG